jgi:hypothetical protein
VKAITHLRSVLDDATCEHLLVIGKDEHRITLNETEALFLALRLLPPRFSDALRVLLVIDALNAQEH